MLSLTATGGAFAHAGLAVKDATVGTTYKGDMVIGHGCEGTATHTVTIEIPEGVISVKPMPKAGWDVETTTAPYANTYQNHGKEVTEGVVAITWSGGKLLDAHFDEFSFRGTLTDKLETGKPVYFKTTQICETGTHEWVEIPAEGQDPHELKGPAPALMINPAAAAHNH